MKSWNNIGTWDYRSLGARGNLRFIKEQLGLQEIGSFMKPWNLGNQ